MALTPEERARVEEEARLHAQAAEDTRATQNARGFVGCFVYPVGVCVFALIAIVFPPSLIILIPLGIFIHSRLRRVF